MNDEYTFDHYNVEFRCENLTRQAEQSIIEMLPPPPLGEYECDYRQDEICPSAPTLVADIHYTINDDAKIGDTVKVTVVFEYQEELNLTINLKILNWEVLSEEHDFIPMTLLGALDEPSKVLDKDVLYAEWNIATDLAYEEADKEGYTCLGAYHMLYEARRINRWQRIAELLKI